MNHASEHDTYVQYVRIYTTKRPLVPAQRGLFCKSRSHNLFPCCRPLPCKCTGTWSENYRSITNSSCHLSKSEALRHQQTTIPLPPRSPSFGLFSPILPGNWRVVQLNGSSVLLTRAVRLRTHLCGRGHDLSEVMADNQWNSSVMAL